MRIIIATGIFPPAIGGPATYTQFLIDYEEEIGIAPVTVVTYGNEDTGSWGDQVKIISNTNREGLRHIKYQRELISSAKESDFIYAVDSSLGVVTTAKIAALANKAKLIVRVTGDYAWEQSKQKYGIKEDIDEFQKHKYSIGIESFRIATRAAIRSADWVVVPSEYLKRLAIGWGVDSKRIEVIPNPVTIYPISADSRNKARVKLGIQGKKVIISSGRFVPWKGFHELIKIFPTIKDRFDKSQLIIIGDGPDRSQLEKEVAQNEAKHAIHFTGSLKKPELIEWLSAADLFVLNSAYEGLSHQLIEAVQGFGLPAVATRVGGNEEVYKEFPDQITLVPVHDDHKLVEAITSILDKNVQPLRLHKITKFSHSSVLKELKGFFARIYSTTT